LSSGAGKDGIAGDDISRKGFGQGGQTGQFGDHIHLVVVAGREIDEINHCGKLSSLKFLGDHEEDTRCVRSRIGTGSGNLRDGGNTKVLTEGFLVSTQRPVTIDNHGSSTFFEGGIHDVIVAFGGHDVGSFELV